MLEQLFDFIAHSWDAISPCHVLRAYEGGVKLRLGKYRQDCASGIVWKWPIVEEVLSCHTAITTARLPYQTLTTQDKKQVGVRAIVKYRVEKPKEYLLGIWDAQDAIEDFTMGCIKGVVNAHTFDELITEDIEKLILSEVRKECNQYGLKIFKITFTDMGATKTLRFMSNTDHGELDG